MRRLASLHGMLPIALLLAACSGSARDTRDVVLVVLDTARADHFSAYGYARETTPNIDRLAEEGVRYANARAQAPWTLPAIATILTGQPPHVHGAGRGAAGILPVRPIRDEVPTLAEALAAAGYQTAAFTNVAWCRPESGLARGFAHYDYRSTDESNSGHRSAKDTAEAALEWLRGVGPESIFLVVHYFDPHLTYAPPAPFDRIFDDEGAQLHPSFGSARAVTRVRSGEILLSEAQRRTLVARYDGELAYTDREFGRLRAGLEELERWNDALVVVVADHGEEFWDHGGFEHGHSHYRELLHIPLIVKHPGGPAGIVRTERVRQLDLAPTILEYAGLPTPNLPGAVLGSASADFSVAEGSLWSGDLVSIDSDTGTLILDRSSGESFFFAAADEEQRDPQPGETAPELLRLAKGVPPTRGAAGDAHQPSAQEIEQLRALGYAD